ncbi:Sodium-driven chloride bicarbonate exchanger [Nymphon striatum]|nr:Sodium-driven chloride bicarbonate exchanger [Nymphon striatum]
MGRVFTFPFIKLEVVGSRLVDFTPTQGVLAVKVLIFVMDVENKQIVTDEAVKDQRALGSLPSYSDLDFTGHKAHITYSGGLHIPGVKKRGHHKRHRHHHDSKKESRLSTPNVDGKPVTPPSQRVQFILGEDEDDTREIHPLFSEMEELHGNGEDMEWRETARWVKFEEDVEEGGNRWSKPHVATLSLHSLFELRSCILHGTVMLDMEAQTLDQIADLVLENLINQNHLPVESKDKVKEILLRKHRHQHEKSHKTESLGSRLPLIRSLADIGRNASKPSFLSHNNSYPAHTHDEDVNVSPSANSLPFGGGSANSGASSSNTTNVGSSGNNDTSPNLINTPSSGKSGNHDNSSSDMLKGNQHFMKKIPADTEASNILVGELDFLDRSIIAFVRMAPAVLLGDLTEVPVPTRFLFVLLGPSGNLQRYHHIGRAIATLMSDEIFHDVAYKARNRQDLLAGVDEFLDSVTVLPPGEWDPSIRIEPPQHVPSQQSRYTPNKSEQVKDEHFEEEKEREKSGLKRTGKLFGGLINDLKRKRPWYLSDFKDVCAVQCLASFFFIYFACLTPIVTFGGLLATATQSRMAAIESLLSGAIVGISYSLFSGQPLTILGSTGPVLIFEATVYNIIDKNEWEFLPFRLWIGLWTSVILIILVATDASALVCYITRFTEENFATLISLIFIAKAIEELLVIGKHKPLRMHPDIPLECSCEVKNNSSILNGDFDPLVISKENCSSIYNGTMSGTGCDTLYVPDVFLMSILLFFGTYIISVFLKEFKTAPFFPTAVRQIVSDFAVIIAIVLMSLVNAIVGLDTPTLDVPNTFEPTWKGRGWLIHPFGINPWWSALMAVFPAILCTILIFMDQQITAVIVNRKENKLKKGCGYHLDLLIVAICIAICGILGLPWFVAATVLSITHVNSLKVESECAAPGEKPHFLGVREQRVTHLLVFVMIGLSVFLTSVLKYIPMPVLYGVFLYMGTSSLKGSQFVDRMMLMLMPQKYQPDYVYLRHVPTKRVHLFTTIQIVCLASLWGIKSNKETAILFPVMVAAMIFVRKLLDFIFTQRELKILDDVMPESTKRKKEEEEQHLNKNESEGLHIAKSGNNVSIQLPTGNVLKIPVKKMKDKKRCPKDESNVNITEEMTKTCTWQNIDQNSSGELSKKFDENFIASKRGTKKDALDDEERKRLSIMNEDDEDADVGITINIDSPTPVPSESGFSNNETPV